MSAGLLSWMFEYQSIRNTKYQARTHLPHLPHHADANAQHPRFLYVDRLHRRVSRLEANSVLFGVPTLERRLVIVGQGDDDLTLLRRVLLANYNVITVGDMVFDHR